MKKICESCGKEFTSKTSQKYCSDDCRKMIKICEYCGEEYQVVFSKPEQKYCSTQCYTNSQKIPLITKDCLFCGEKYETKNRFQKFCGKICSSASYHSRSITKTKRIAKSLPVLVSRPTIPIWQTKIYIGKKLFKKFSHTGTVHGIIRKIISMEEQPEKYKPIDIHIEKIGESKIEND